MSTTLQTPIGAPNGATQDDGPDGMLAYQLAIRYPNRDDPNWPLPSFDAQDWAKAFCEIAAKNGHPGIDEGWMISWFANALMRGYDEHAMRTARVESKRKVRRWFARLARPSSAVTACAAIFTPVGAFAQAVAPSPATVDLTAVANTLLGLASAAVLTAIPILVPALLKRFGVANAKALSDQFDTLANAGAGAAYAYALAHEGGLANVAVHNDAIAHGLNYVIGKAPDLLKAAGLSNDSVSSAVAARLGALLATDPTVTAGKPVAGQNPMVVPMAAPVVAAAPAGA